MLNEFYKIAKELEYVLETSLLPLKDYVEQYITIWNRSKMEEVLDFIINNKVRNCILYNLLLIIFALL